ncbi:MAG: hypothetical protein F6K31_09810, partial [Symploca sp. SIO2G7]|nr:hypothetical protein [Symploca sp. SIO2G7]
MSKIRLIRKNIKSLSRAMRGSREISHLEQIGSSPFYWSSGEPADPRDCARWPHSPYCSGSFWTPLAAGFEYEVINDKCNLGFSFTPILGGFRSANIEILYRKAACRGPSPDQQNTAPKTNAEGLPQTPRVDLPLDFYGVFIIAQKIEDNYYREHPDWGVLKWRSIKEWIDIDYEVKDKSTLGFWDEWIILRPTYHSYIARNQTFLDYQGDPSGPTEEERFYDINTDYRQGRPISLYSHVLDWVDYYRGRSPYFDFSKNYEYGPTLLGNYQRGAVLKQGVNTPYPVEEMTVSIYAGTRGYL